jgi:hypothetical protein
MEEEAALEVESNLEPHIEFLFKTPPRRAPSKFPLFLEEYGTVTGGDENKKACASFFHFYFSFTHSSLITQPWLIDIVSL